MTLYQGKLYFTQFEKELILALVQPYLNIVENKETNNVISAKKTEVFNAVTVQFNNTHGVNQRTEKQIRQCYLNLKKKMKNIQRKMAGGKIRNEVRVSNAKVGLLCQPMLTLPMPTTVSSETNQIDTLEVLNKEDIQNCVKKEIPDDEENLEVAVESQYQEEISKNDSSTSDVYVCSLTSLHTESSELEATFGPIGGECVDNPCERILPEQTSLTIEKPKPPETVMNSKKKKAQSEHSMMTKYRQKEEERKERQAEAAELEHELRMELLQEQIRLTRTKTLIHEKILNIIDKDPSSLNILKNIVSDN